MTILDVRSPEEFEMEHAEGSINIPLQELKERMNELSSFTQPIVLCCASGNRSGQAAAFLRTNKIDCINGGSWVEVENNLKNK